MPTLALILARAGSKGLPGKNAAPLLGKPLLHYTLDHALGSSSVDRIVLSTDGEALAAIGRDAGVEVMMRPLDLANDTATVDAAARHAVDTCDPHRHADAVVLLYGNVPIRPADLTDRAVTKLRDTGCDSVQSLCPVGKHHPYWMKTLVGDDGDTLEPYQPNAVYRRQDLPPAYELDGGIIAVTRDSLFSVEPGQPHAFLGPDRRAILTRPGDVIDVDEPFDLLLAETVLRQGASEHV